MVSRAIQSVLEWWESREERAIFLVVITALVGGFSAFVLGASYVMTHVGHAPGFILFLALAVVVAAWLEWPGED